MLKIDFAFCVACKQGHQKTAEWLLGLCQTAEEKTAMLHAKDDLAFIMACEHEHLEASRMVMVYLS